MKDKKLNEKPTYIINPLNVSCNEYYAYQFSFKIYLGHHKRFLLSANTDYAYGIYTAKQ